MLKGKKPGGLRALGQLGGRGRSADAFSGRAYLEAEGRAQLGKLPLDSATPSPHCVVGWIAFPPARMSRLESPGYEQELVLYFILLARPF